MARPVPKPPPPKKRWFQEQRSEYPWEQEGLDHVEALMPKVEPYRAWATFSFIVPSGRVHECDLFIATPGGLYLVELKGHPGRVVNRGSTWRFHGPDRIRTMDNPLSLVNLKSKQLRSQLQRAAERLGYSSVKVPRIEPAVFLTDPNLTSELDEVQRTRVYGRNDADTGLPRIWDDLLGRPPAREPLRVDADFSVRLPAMMEKAGISHSQAHLRFGDGWRLEAGVLDAGPTWEDRLAVRKDIVTEEGRVRIYLVGRQATDEARRSVDRAARREYQVLQGINHRGIAQAVLIREHQGGPAILFRHDHRDLRLDAYLNVHGASLTPDVRLDLVRQLAEAVRHAHNRSLYHRALAARSVYVSAKEDGSRPVLRIIDWQTAARDFDTTTPPTIGNSSLDDTHLQDAALPYLAPEFDIPYADPVDLDVFGMGAVAYLILTGQPPAPDRDALRQRVSADGGLSPYAVADGITEDLNRLILRATAGDPNDRLESADRFLELLDRVEADSARGLVAGDGLGDAWEGTDPLTAMPGQAVDGDADGVWRVERFLGSGATSKALLVARTVEDDDGEQAREVRVLKVALDESKAEQLRAEAKALAKVGGGAIRRLLGGPRELGGRTVLDLEFAGERTLAAVLHDDGKLTYHQLEQYGRDLFRALDQLAARGVRHRDLKPENFGVLRRADRTWELKLLDFSLTHVSDRNTSAGTAGYLDPFLGTPGRPDFDDHAERYAAAVTLHEMASGERPTWGDGKTDPRALDDPVPYLAADLFEPALREGLTAFFRRALHRDAARRFDTLAQMENAWREIFRRADATAPATTQATLAEGLPDTGADPDAEQLALLRDKAAAAATLGTELVAAGLSPRAVAVAASFNATTVGELLDVPLYKIAKARGAGAVARKELNRRHKQWTAALRPQQPAGEPARPDAPAGPGAGEPVRVDELSALLLPSSVRRGSSKARVLRLTLGLPDDGALVGEAEGLPAWPTQAQVAARLDTTQATVSRHHREAIKEWAAASWLEPVRTELVTLVTESGAIATAGELAAALRARHGAAGRQPAATAMAKAMALVRAAVEAETWIGPGESGHEPRLAVLRRGPRVLVTLESLPGTADPSPRELADYAVALGGVADALAATDPLPGRDEVIRELRRVVPPDGMSPLADTRLVRLAAEVAAHALASPGLQLYPRDLDLAKALRIAQAGAGVRHPEGITTEDLLARVQARFPGLDAYRPVPTYVRLEEALKEAGFPLEYDPSVRRFLPPAPSPASWESTGTATGLLSPPVPLAGSAPGERAAARLERAVREGGFVALTVALKRLPGTAEAIAAAYPVASVDVAEVVLAEFRALAAENGVDWAQVLRVDEKLTREGRMPRMMGKWVATVMDRTGQRLRERAAAPQTVLFLHNAGLLARYADQGGHALLTGLQNAARRAGDAPHGLWLLCPQEAPRAMPNLDGMTVEAIGESERTVVDRHFHSWLHGPTAA